MRKQVLVSMCVVARGLVGPTKMSRPRQASWCERELESLASTSAWWHSTTQDERAAVAQEMLEGLGKVESGDWIGECIELETGYERSEAPPELASSTRVAIAMNVVTFLETFIKAARHERPRLEDGIPVPRLGVSMRLVVGSPRVAEVAAAGKACLVLGAGNENFLSIIDVLHRTLVHGECVLLKHHPLRPWLAQPYGQALAPLVRRGVVAQTEDEGVENTAQALRSPFVGHVHMTGGEATYRAVRATVDATTTVSAELGCVTPYVVVGGEWTTRELAYAAKLLVYAKKTKGGAMCCSPQVCVLPTGWPFRDRFVAAVRAELGAQPDNKAYYPGARARRDAFLEAPDDQIALLDLHDAQSHRLLQTEVFGPLLAIVDAHDPVSFANHKLAGSLSCAVLAPASADDETVDALVNDLLYGVVAYNAAPFVAYVAAQAGGTWGAHPRAYDDDRSGVGIVGDIYGLGNVEKTILDGGALAKPRLDVTKSSPPLVLDALYATLLPHPFRRLANLLFRRLVLRNRTFGTARISSD